MRTYSELEEVINTNSAGAATEWLDVKDNNLMSVSLWGETGTHNTHKIKIEGSPDGVNAHAVDIKNGSGVAYELTGQGTLVGITICTRYVRAKVLVAEGAASTSRIWLQAK